MMDFLLWPNKTACNLDFVKIYKIETLKKIHIQQRWVIENTDN